jgi:ABC-type multidrug transport system fused ATPase/permease subunit
MKINFKINNYLFWIFLALLINGIFFWLQVYLNYAANKPLLGYYSNDSHEYYHSAENFFASGIYSPDVRMPGLGIIFILFRLFFEKTIVLNIILVLQWLLSAVSSYVLAITISRVIKKETVFYFVFFLVTLTNYIFHWSVFLLAESFCISFFIFSLYYYDRFFETGFKKHLFWCGLFFTWCVFLRPVFLMFYGLAAVCLLLYFLKHRTNFKTIVASGVIFFSVFLVCDSAWTVRNYHKKNKFIFLNDISFYTEISGIYPHPALYYFLKAWGGDVENEINWFEIDKSLNYHNRDTILPDHIYTSQFNKDSLLLVKERIRFLKKHPSDSIVWLINNSLQNFTRSIKEEKPFLYYIGSGFVNLKKLLFRGYGNYNSYTQSYSELPVFKKVYRTGKSLLFYAIFFTGALSLFWFLILKKKNYFIIFLFSVGFSNLIYISFFFLTPEFRYVLPSTLVFMCLTGIVADAVLDKVKRRLTSVKQ